MHDLEKALKDIEDALNDKETPVRFFHQAEIYLQLGQENSARTAIFKAVQMGLTKDMLQPLEVPAYEKLKQLAEVEVDVPVPPATFKAGESGCKSARESARFSSCWCLTGSCSAAG